MSVKETHSSPAIPALSLHFLGGFKVVCDAAPLSGFAYDKVRALLAYLACNRGQPLPRERLADLLWPSCRSATARGNLRRTLHDLRTALGDSTEGTSCLLIERQCLGFTAHTGQAWLDVQQFLAEPPPELADDTQTLQQQLALYRGPFLAGLSLPDAPDFEIWLEQQRERIKARALCLLRRLSLNQERNGQLEAAIATLHQEVSLEPWAESGHRHLMRLLASKGQTAAALAQYEICRAILAQELGISPDAETQELHRRIRQGEMPGSTPTSISPTSAQPAQERRLICVLLTEVIPLEIMADWQATEMLGDAHGSCMETLHRHGGHCLPLHMGRILAYFGYPDALEDMPQRAAMAALGLVQQHGVGSPLRLRAVLHCGWALHDHRYHLPDATGQLTEQVTQLLAHSSWGEVSLTPEMARLIERHFLVTPVFQDTALPMQRIVAPSGTAQGHDRPSRPQPPLVGRRSELGLLELLWARTCKGERQHLLLQGEPGIGKSRLVQALLERLQPGKGTWRLLRCSPESRHTPYHPIIDLLQRRLGQLPVPPAHQPDVQLRQLERWLAPTGSPLRPHLPALAALLGFTTTPEPESGSPQQRKQAREQAILALLASLASQQPLLLIIEDLHWADPSTLELLKHFLASGQQAIFTLLTARPDFAAPSALPSLALGPLSAHQTVRLARLSCAPGQPLQRQQLATLLGKSDGIPLYIEEMARSYSESPGEQLPDTLWSLLASRLESVGSAARQLAQQAAAIGREFPLELLEALWEDSNSTFVQALKRLQQSGLIQPGNRTEGRFRHALIRDAAYQTLAPRERRQLHGRLAQLLQGRFHKLVSEAPERLAQHLGDAGQPLAAAQTWLQAGRLAVSQSANQEAIFHFQAGLNQLTLQPHSSAHQEAQANALELSLQAALGNTLIAVQGYGSSAAKQCFARALTLSRTVPGNTELFPVIWGLWLGGRSCTPEAYPLEFNQQLERIALNTGAADQKMQAHYAYGNNLFWLARYDEARQHLQQAISLGQSLPAARLIHLYGEDTRISSGSFLSWLQLICGDENAALATSAATLQQARQLGHAHSLGFALTFAAMLQRLRHHPAATEQLADELLQLAHHHELALWQAAGASLKGWSLAVRGNPEGLAAIRHAVAAARVAMVVVEATFMALEADACLHLGYYTECQNCVEASLKVCQQREDFYFQPELMRLGAQALIAQTPASPTQHAQALQLLQQAASLASQQGAVLFRKRADKLCRTMAEEGFIRH